MFLMGIGRSSFYLIIFNGVVLLSTNIYKDAENIMALICNCQRD